MFIYIAPYNIRNDEQSALHNRYKEKENTENLFQRISIIQSQIKFHLCVSSQCK